MSKFVYGLWLMVYGVLAISTVLAQNLPNAGGVAVNVEIDDGDILEGHIISATADGFKKSDKAYDIQMYGVVVSFPILSVKPRDDTTKAVVSSGETMVRVSAKNGEIAVGDFITSSDEVGVGQKATESGYVLGKALQEYKDGGQNGLIVVSVNPNYYTARVDSAGPAGTIARALADALSDPERFTSISRLILGSIVGILAFLAAAFAFIKFMATGIEAIGRNPLAKRTIIAGMVISGGVVAILAIAGAGIVLTIIRVGA